MPDFLTHARFAQRLLNEGEFSLAACCRRHANLFRLGSQGPDLLYYLAYLAPGHGYTAIADQLHELQMTDILEVLHDLDFTSPDYPFACAYLGGYAAHLCLDNVVHPMICEKAAEISRKTGCTESCAHVKYENRLESRHFTETTGDVPGNYLLRGDLPATERERDLVAAANVRIIQVVTGKTISRKSLTRALKRLPALLRFLFDREGKARKWADRLFANRETGLKWHFKRPYEPDEALLSEQEYAQFLALYQKAIEEYLNIVG